MLPWIEPHQPLPPPESAQPEGIVAAGRDLSARRLLEAYRNGMFPWYSAGQPVLWWSPDPRMVVEVAAFEPSRSLRRTVKKVRDSGVWQVRLDTAFVAVMRGCASPRPGQGGTWITREIIAAYAELHRAGHAHSVEVWRGDALIGGLYGVSIGRMFFGESMFTRVPDASKCAYVALIAMLRRLEVPMVDCQQSTTHLASLGGREISRTRFLAEVRRLCGLPGPDWSTASIDWPA